MPYFVPLVAPSDDDPDHPDTHIAVALWEEKGSARNLSSLARDYRRTFRQVSPEASLERLPEERHAGRTMAVFRHELETQSLTETTYLFRLAGRSWQVDYLATQLGLADLRKPCRAVLDSVRAC